MQKEGISGSLYPEANMLAMTEFRRFFCDQNISTHPLLISNRINLTYESKF